MIPWWWSWVLIAVGITGLWLAGSRRKVGWLLNIGNQVLWVTYAIATRQYGFIVGAAAYLFVYTRNYLKWRRESVLVFNHDKRQGEDFAEYRFLADIGPVEKEH